MSTVIVSGSAIVSSSTSNNYIVDGQNHLEVQSGVTVNGFIEVGSTNPSPPNGVTIDFGATAANSIIDAGGTEFVAGTSLQAIVYGQMWVVQGNGSIFNTIVSNGGSENLFGGFSTNTQILQGGTSNIYRTSTAFGETVYNGGTLNVLDGISTGATLFSGAQMYVTKGDAGGGTANFTNVGSGAFISVSNTGNVFGSNVYGTEDIWSGSLGSGDVIAASGNLFVAAGGQVSSESVFGYATISGVGSSDVINSGGVEVVSGTGSVSNETVYGTLELQSGSVATGTIAFEGGHAKLLIDSNTVNTSTVGSTLVDFGAGDTIDLTAINYSSGMHVVRGATQSGHAIYNVETAAGTIVAALQMTPNLVGDNFFVKNDGAGHAELTGVVVPDPAHQSHPNDLTYAVAASGTNHFIDLQNFEASYPDLIQAFGTNTQAMQNWYNTTTEHRVETFDGLDYIASYGDLISAFHAGSMQQIVHAGALHDISFGLNEGRTTTFNGLDYIASYSDLIQAYGWNSDAGAFHFIERGYQEGRTTTFDGLNYIASYSDLIKDFGANEQAGAAHFIGYGHAEGRTTTFDGLAYIAQYTDLMNDFGANNDAGAYHYIVYGSNEGRSGAGFNVAAYEQAHPDLIGKFATNDAFLTAYINTYHDTGSFLV